MTKQARVLTFDGKSLTVAQWSKAIGIRPEALHKRLQHGWSVEDALTTPLSKRGRKPNEIVQLPARVLFAWRDHFSSELSAITNGMLEANVKQGEALRVSFENLMKSYTRTVAAPGAASNLDQSR